MVKVNNVKEKYDQIIQSFKNNNFEDIEGKNDFEKKNIFVNWKDIEKFGNFFENNGNNGNMENSKNLKNSENKNIGKKEIIKNISFDVEDRRNCRIYRTKWSTEKLLQLI